MGGLLANPATANGLSSPGSLAAHRTDDFYYLKDGKVVKTKTGTPADQDELINIYYPGED
jgi:hypothetical protein